MAAASGGAAGSSVDINSIPIAAIERIEILKDGASAVYGSDAIAGVVNFILRKNFQGAEVTATGGTPTDRGGGQNQSSRRTWATATWSRIATMPRSASISSTTAP